jgi:hypothetical protein
MIRFDGKASAKAPGRGQAGLRIVLARAAIPGFLRELAG